MKSARLAHSLLKGWSYNLMEWGCDLRQLIWGSVKSQQVVNFFACYYYRYRTRMRESCSWVFCLKCHVQLNCPRYHILFIKNVKSIGGKNILRIVSPQYCFIDMRLELLLQKFCKFRNYVQEWRLEQLPVIKKPKSQENFGIFPQVRIYFGSE